MKIRIHWLFIVFLIYTGYVGQFVEAAIFFAIVIIHELGHVFVAKAFGWKVTEIEFLPFGGVAKVDWNFKGWPREEKLVAIAGPINNFLMIAVAFIFFQLGILSRDFALFFIKVNMMIAGFNLLPALPLDGGRVFRAMMSQEHGWVKGTEMSYRFSYGIGGGLIAIAVGMMMLGYMNMTFLILGGFLILATYTDQRQSQYQQMYIFLHKNYNDNDRQMTTRPVRHISADSTEPVTKILKLFSPGITTIVWVMDNHKILGTLTDYEMLQKIFEQHVPLHVPVSEMLR